MKKKLTKKKLKQVIKIIEDEGFDYALTQGALDVLLGTNLEDSYVSARESYLFLQAKLSEMNNG